MVTSRDGNVNISAQSGTISGARSDYESNYRYTQEQKGFTLAFSSPITDAIQAVESMTKSAKGLGSSKNDRINTLGAVNAGFEAKRLAEQLGNLGSSLAQNPTQAPSQGVSVSLTYGQQKTEQTQHTEGNGIEKSQINAGGEVNLNIKGKGDASTLDVLAADVSGNQGTHLNAEGKVNIAALDENHLERSKNKSSGFNTGVAVSFGQGGMSYGITAGGNKSKGHGNGDSQSRVASKVGSTESKTTITSGSDVNLLGAQVAGKGVAITAENLNIQSLQDTAHFEGKQESIQGQVTVGMGASASGSYNKSKISNDYASVNTQAGIYAGDEGYDVQIRKNTHLEGGLITSTDKAEAEGKNRFETGTISFKNIENHADSKGSAVGISGGISANFNTPLGDKGMVQSNKTVKDKDEKEHLATGKASLQGSVDIGYGHTGEHQNSVTKSGINTQNITIHDSEAQAQTGKTVEEAKAALKTETSTDNAESRSGKLANNFNKEKMLKELNIQVKVTKEFRQNAFSAIDDYIEPKQAELREKVKEAKTEEEKTVLYNEIYKLQYQKRLLQTTVGLVAGTPELAITQGTLQLAATKMREESLANSRKFDGVYEKDAKTKKLVKRGSNVYYESGYFDGVKLGGVRIDLDIICGKDNSRCKGNTDDSVIYEGDSQLRTYNDAINPNLNEDAKDLYGETGGFQSAEGGWYLGGKPLIPYKPNDISDYIVESFAGTHDMLGGQIWGWYDEQGNTSRKTPIQRKLAQATTITAIPVSAPFAAADLMSPDFLEILMKIGGQ